MVQRRKYSLSTGIANSFMGLSWCVAKKCEKGSNWKWTRLHKSGMFMPLTYTLFSCYLILKHLNTLYTPKYSVAKSHRHTALKQGL